jgi:hypothetical protein
MAMKESIQDCFPAIDAALNDELHPLAGCDPIWILNWLTSDKYLTSLKPKKRIVLSPNTKEQLLEWVKSDAFSSNSLGALPYIDGTATEAEMIAYARDLVRSIEYEDDPENLKELIRAAKWNLKDVELLIKEL